MLKVGDIVSSFFQLVLRILFKLTPDIVDKSLRISEDFLKEDFKIKLYDQSGALMMALVLSPSETDRVQKIKSGKQDIIYLGST